ncbi:MAG TPA: pca operon transcription factor PcaQ [Methylomirabilota bacterium]|nr:pca operon transcription factor PcaQ [Methylomirabilota bacterium]
MPNRRIKLRHLRCFLAVARYGGIGAAAQEIGTTQPAASKTVLELEQILGAKLFSRSRAGTQLTEAGRIFRRHAEESLAALSAGVSSLAEAGTGARAVVSVGALPTVAARLMPRAVKSYQAAGGDDMIRVISGTNTAILADLRAGSLDLVVGRMADGDGMSGLSFEHLYPEVVVFVVRDRHPLLADGRFDPERIAGFPVLLPTPGSIIRPAVDRLLKRLGIADLSPVVESVSPSFGRVFVAGTDAVWIISRGVVETDLGEGGLALLPVDTSDTAGPVGLTLRAELPPPVAVLRVIQAIRDAAADLRDPDG